LITPPNVSIIVPCLNEEFRIQQLLEAVYTQTYPKNKMDVTIADGGSIDNTRAVIESFAASHSAMKISVIENPQVTIPSALNCAIRASSGEVILRLDSHSAPYSDYVEKAVDALLQGNADNVGGVWDIRSSEENWISRSIAVAAAHPIGVGNAQYRHTTVPSFVDTVPFGCFYRTLLEKIGFFDETMLSNEDYEFNARIRKSGGKIWLDPSIKCVYYARADLAKLTAQYFRYGYWKFKMLKKFPATIIWRQALPPIFAFSLLAGILLGAFSPLFLVMVELELIAYFSILLFFGLREAINRKAPQLTIGFPISVAAMHLSWGYGFLWSILF
jgi:cellulose synthase/poly-beta-1,6-N-acetylglucosamine synthase-like glycosyltransferase